MLVSDFELEVFKSLDIILNIKLSIWIIFFVEISRISLLNLLVMVTELFHIYHIGVEFVGPDHPIFI